jgi:hypothetical protein
MSIARRLRTAACCAILEIGTLTGVPMRPEQIQDLMRAMNVPKIARTNPEQSPSGDQSGGKGQFQSWKLEAESYRPAAHSVLTAGPTAHRMPLRTRR